MWRSSGYERVTGTRDDPADGNPRAGAIRGWPTAAANNATGHGVEDDDVAFHT
jgi:hypothetical protein